MPPQLVALNEGPSISLDKPILLLGRHQECDIQLASRKVSRKHCCIAQVNDYLVVRDLGSMNGVRINGVRVTEGKLKAGDELTVGNHQYRVAWDGESPSAEPQALHPLARGSAGGDILDSFDEPVPIAEPVKPPPGPLPVRMGVPGEAAPVPHALPPTERASAPETSSHILPDQIDLAPSSHNVLTPPKTTPDPPPQRAEEAR